MDNSIYITLTRQLALFRDMDVTSNNIANTNTTGFNSEHLLFNSYITKDINQGDRNPMAMAYNIATYRNTEEGPVRTTGNDLDLAIQGDGYFTVQTPLGERYTRGGNFRMDSTGMVTTQEGYSLLDSSGQPIILPEDTTSIEVGGLGNMKVNGEDFTTVGVVQFANPQLLERLDGRLYKSEIAPQPAENFSVAQGVLEGSNVQPVKELTHMISVSRAVTETAKFIETMYDLERKAANTWAQQS